MKLTKWLLRVTGSPASPPVPPHGSSLIDGWLSGESVTALRDIERLRDIETGDAIALAIGGWAWIERKLASGGRLYMQDDAHSPIIPTTFTYNREP